MRNYLIVINFLLFNSWNTIAQDVSKTQDGNSTVVTSTTVPAPVVASISIDDVINNSLSKVIAKISGTAGKVAVMDFPGLDGKSTGLSAYIAI